MLLTVSRIQEQPPFPRPPLTPSLIPTAAQSQLEEDALLLKVDVALTTPKSEPTLSWDLWLIKSHCVPMPIGKPPLPPPDVLYRLKLNSGISLLSPHLLFSLATCFNYCPSQIFLYVAQISPHICCEETLKLYQTLFLMPFSYPSHWALLLYVPPRPPL